MKTSWPAVFLSGLSALALGSPTAAASLGEFFGLTSARSPPVARKIAEFKESFVAGGMDFSADGTQLAVNGMADGRDVDIWQWRMPAHMVRALTKDAGAGSGNEIQFSPDGSLLAVGHAGEKVETGARVLRIWSTNTGEVARDIIARGSSGVGQALAFVPNGELLLRTVEGSGFASDYVAAYRTDSWDQVWGQQTFPFVPQRLAVSHNGRLLALAGSVYARSPSGLPGTSQYPHARIEIVDISTRATVRTIEQAFPNGSVIASISWSARDTALAAGIVVGDPSVGPDAVRIFDPTTGQLLAKEPCKEAFVTGLAYTADGLYLIEGYIDGMLRIWDGTHRHLLQTIPVNEAFNTILAISRDSRHMAIAAGKNVSIWELK